MQKKDFLYFLTDDQGRCYKTDVHGNVFCDAQVQPLSFTPDGWQDKTINYTRNTTYFGMVRQFTVPLKFVKDGAEIVRWLFYSNGIEAVCYLRIAKLNRATGNHEKYFVGALDFSTFDDMLQYVQVSILDSGLASMIKSKEGTTFEIPMGTDTTDPVPVGVDPTVNVLLDGIALVESLSYTSLNIVHGQISLIGIGTHFPDEIFVNTEGSSTGLNHQDVDFSIINDISGISASNKWIIESDKGATINVSLDYDIDVASPIQGAVAFAQVWVGKTVYVQQFPLTDQMVSVADEVFVNYKGTKTATITLGPGEKMFVFTMLWNGVPPGSGTGNLVMRYNKFDLKASVSTRADATYCKALKPSFVYQRLIHKLSGLINNTQSQLLDNNDTDLNYSILMTTGDAIRRLDGITMKVTFQDFFKAMDVVFNVGFGVANEIGILERKDYFYDDADTLISLDDISNLAVSVDKDDIYNLVNIGYPAQTYDDVNGKDEFNNTSQFSIPITRIQNTLDLVSSYRADMYGIEFTRIQTIGQDTTDTSSDDTIFFLVVENKIYTDPLSDQPFYKLYRPAGATVTGIISPTTAFNIEISPKHLLMRHGNYLHAMCDKLETKDLIFQTANKNDSMAITYRADPLLVNSNPVTVVENANMPIHLLDYKLFLPYIFEFDTEIADGVKNIFDNNPKGIVQFNWKGNTYKGFIMDCSIKPAFRESQSWKLLAAPDNDMTKLFNNG
ncbi:MAG: hypothetical protein EPN37_07235 [Chitinophagaceae bacterium]|nr:MAG: hypothetical protein EPN37_07235 [Chitinophagaceae bacterium]